MNTRTRRVTPVRRIRRGLTLIEVLIVIAIILAIGGIVTVNLMGSKEKADLDLQKASLKQLETAISQFRLHMKRYPTEDEGLTVLVSKGGIEKEDEQANWAGPYIEPGERPVNKDSWNHDLIYRPDGEINGEGNYDLISVGPDGEEGTADDITNRKAGLAGGESGDDLSNFTDGGSGGGSGTSGTGG